MKITMRENNRTICSMDQLLLPSEIEFEKSIYFSLTFLILLYLYYSKFLGKEPMLGILAVDTE